MVDNLNDKRRRHEALCIDDFFKEVGEFGKNILY